PQRRPGDVRYSRGARHRRRPGGIRSRIAAGPRDRPLVRPRSFGRLARLDVSLRSSPGQFLGNRPTAQAPDSPLSDDDRTGIRALYPDPNDAINIGAIRGHVLPANPFALATLPAPSPGVYVTGIFGAHVVAVNADTGAVIAATLGGWTCDSSNSSLQ